MRAALARLERHPEMYERSDYGDFRICQIRKSSYLLAYSYDTMTDEIQVNAALHVRQDPKNWRVT